MRTSKSRNGVTYNYIYDGNTLVAEQHTNGTVSEWIYYIYGIDGIAGFRYNGITYLFRKNVQGDVTHIYKQEEDKSLTLVAKYVYDAWGNYDVLDASDEIDDNVNSIGNLNPFRYRGYYFDSETGLYYLRTRYYDPEIGRFISADSIEYLDPETLGGLNLYAYCGNNPVMFSDPEGTTQWWEWLLAGILVAGLVAGAVFTGGLVAAAFTGAAIGAGFSLVSQSVEGSLNWEQFALDAGIGAITGMLGASGIGRPLATVLGGALGGISDMTSQLIAGTGFCDINWGKVGFSVVVGAFAGYISGAGARNMSSVSNASGVAKSINSVNRVLEKASKGLYSSARYAKTALTNVSNKLATAIISQQKYMFGNAMVIYILSLAINRDINSIGIRQGWWK